MPRCTGWTGTGLFPRLLSFLAPGGVLAVQMPDMYDTPLRQIPCGLAAMEPWSEHLDGVASAPGILQAAEYWDLLRPHVASLDLWRTTYMHALSGENAVMEWASGSSLRAFLDRLPEARKGSIPPSLLGCGAVALSATRRRHDTAGVPPAVYRGAQGVSSFTLKPDGAPTLAGGVERPDF